MNGLGADNMSIPKFFIDQAQFSVDDVVVLPADEHRHAMLSRRLTDKSEVILLNGQGVIASGHFIEMTRKLSKILIEKVERNKPTKAKIIIASAIPKGDRQKVMLDMLTQIGVSEFIPLECEFSSVKINDKLMQKWQRIVQEGCKQSGNPFCLRINPPISLIELVNSNFWRNSLCFRTEQFAETDINEDTNYDNSMNLLAVIGPEGGLSEDEKNLLDTANARKLSFSKYILRTETAAVAASIRLLEFLDH